MQPRESNSTRLPKEWIRRPRIGSLMEGGVICCKVCKPNFPEQQTPLDDRYTQIRKKQRWTPSDLLKSKALNGASIGLVVDLTNVTRYYNGEKEFVEKGVSIHPSIQTRSSI